MKIAVILENAPDVELVREEIEVDVAGSDDPQSACDDAISAVIERFILSPGDTIKIRELVARADDGEHKYEIWEESQPAAV